jgi:ubiquinone/menaquinone biosynthesis C-methylase UbiE
MRDLTLKEQGELDFWIDHIHGFGCFRETGKSFAEQWSDGARRRLEFYRSNVPSLIPSTDAIWVDVGTGPYSVLLQAPPSILKIMIDPLMKHYFHHNLVLRPRGPDYVFLEGFGESLPLCDETADAVFCTNALDHAHDPWLSLRELVRILKVGSHLFLEVDTGGETDELHPHSFTVNDLEQRTAHLGLKSVYRLEANMDKRRPGARLYYGFYERTARSREHFPSADPPKRGSLKPMLVAEGIREFNIVRLPDPSGRDVYYGIRQVDGAFSYDRITQGGYRIYYEGSSLEEVKTKIESATA